MKRKDILTILVPTLLIVLLWVVFSVYHNFISSTIPTSVNEQILSINPTFDEQAINSINSRKVVNPIYSVNPQPTGENGQVITPTPTEAAASPSSESAKVATQGGALNQ